MRYETRGYKTRKDFENGEYVIITDGRLKVDAFTVAGVALMDDYAVVKVQSEDREEITVLRRD